MRNFRVMKSAKTIRTGCAVMASSFIVVGLLGSAPAIADTGVQDDSAQVQFGALEDASFSEVYDAIRASNDTDEVAAFFAEASEEPAAVALPGLEELTTAEKAEVLEASAVAAADDAPLPLDELPAEVAPSGEASGPSAFTAGRHSQQRATVSAAFSTSTARTRSKPNIQRASYASAPVAGTAINNRRSWQMSNRYNWSECSIFSCKVTSWLDFRITTDPGKTGSRTSVNFTKWGTKIGNVQINSWVFAAGNNYGASGWKTWNTPGSGVQYNYHNSTLNKSFQVWYEVRIGRPGGTQPFEFKTGKSATCKEPSPAAYQCVF